MSGPELVLTIGLTAIFTMLPQWAAFAVYRHDVQEEIDMLHDTIRHLREDQRELTTAEAARLAKVSVKTIERWATAGDLPRVRRSRGFIYRAEEVLAAKTKKEVA
jgi:excisionase family DNA binding protein